jgi:4-amino-4-deoxy-L-arabinose transferase-like glycosyltransferase
MTAAPAEERLQVRNILLVSAVIALFVFLSHATFLRLPFYWDELGQYVPASLDLFQSGSWIPHSTLANVHPPGVMAYLAAVWSIAGFSIAATRLAMLGLGALGAVLAFRLAIRLDLPWSAAILAAGFLVTCPLFFAQSMMAQLDMPAMVFVVLALTLFLEDRIPAAALACMVLVMVKETGLVAPAWFCVWLWRESRRREALWFLLPLAPLILWLVALHHGTGHWFGNAAFTQYNLWYPLHPVRLALALLRRLYYLFGGTGHWIGVVALVTAWRGTTLFRTRPWRIAGGLAVAQVLLVSVLGGAVLERYLVPVLPVLYIAFAAAIWQLAPRWRTLAAVSLAAALLLANFVNPPYPFPLENNLAFTGVVRLDVEAAQYLEARFPTARIATMFPLASAYRRPEFGYVQRPLNIREISDFRASNVAPLEKESVELCVLYSGTWDPIGMMQNATWTAFLGRYYDYEPPVDANQMRVLLGAQPVARWTRHGQWVEIYKR